MSKATVKIALTPGPVVRTIGDIEWSAAAGWVQDVPLELAADLLAYPHPGWSLAESPAAETRKRLADLLGVEPGNIVVPGEAMRRRPTLLEIVGDAERAAQLKELGVGVSDLTRLAEKDVTDLAFRSGATAAEIAGWVEQAKAA